MSFACRSHSPCSRKCSRISLSNASSVLCLGEVISALRKDVVLGMHASVGGYRAPDPGASRIRTGTALAWQCLWEEKSSETWTRSWVARGPALWKQKQLPCGLARVAWIPAFTSFTGRWVPTHNMKTEKFPLQDLTFPGFSLPILSNREHTLCLSTQGTTSGHSWWTVALRLRYSLTGLT